jgi:hypothetical protein
MSVDHVMQVCCNHHNCMERATFLTGFEEVARDNAVSRLGWTKRGKLDYCPYHAPTGPGIEIPEEVDLGLRDLPAP